MRMRTYRKPVLKKFKPIWLTEEAHALLRKEKPRQKKSMMQILDDVIKAAYGSSRKKQV